MSCILSMAMMIMILMKLNGCALASLTLVSTLALSACAADGAEDEEAEDTGQGTPENSANEDGESEKIEPADRESHEAGGPTPRLAITYDGGVSVLDGATLEIVDDFEADGFLRVSPAGDGRHLFLTEGESFRLLDAGTWGEPHGDHNHYYTTDPLLTDVTVDGDTPGHVVSHDGIGTLFFDGTGEIQWFDLADLPGIVDSGEEITTETDETDEAHHGVAVVMEDGSRFETIGDDEDRPGARVLDSEGEELARSEECPGVHGEAAGPEGIVAVGCEDGVLIWDGEEFEKIDSGEEYARTGNLFPAEGSSIFLGDYNLDENGGEMTEVALVDADAGEISTVDVGSPYNFRNLARGPEGEALVLTEDGQLHVIDPETGEHTDHLDVVEEWTEPEEWQEPRPAIRVIDDIAYVTEPDSQQIHMVDLTELEVINSTELDFVPNELEGADGRPVEGVSEDYDGGEGENHDDHDDDHDHGDEDHDDQEDDDQDH